MQVEYLPAMQRGLVKSLREVNQNCWADKIVDIPTANFLTGMNAVITQDPDGDYNPAGTVDFIASGGLTALDLDFIKGITVSDANLSGLLEFYGAILLDDQGMLKDCKSLQINEKEKLRGRLLQKKLEV
jgi:hypothetical protein